MGHLWFGSTTTFFRRRLAASGASVRWSQKSWFFTTCIVTQQKYGIGLKIFWMMFWFLMVNHYKYSCKSLKLMGYLFKILPLWTTKTTMRLYQLGKSPSSFFWQEIHDPTLQPWTHLVWGRTYLGMVCVSTLQGMNYGKGHTSFPDHLGSGRCYLPKNS